MGEEYAAYYRARQNHQDKEGYVNINAMYILLSLLLRTYILVHAWFKMVAILFYSYQWYCHIDDDVYVNIPQLSQLLQKYDPNQPQYIGRWRQDNHHKPYFPVSNRSFVYFTIYSNIIVTA